MFTPNELEAVPEYFSKLFRDLQLNIMTDIIQRLSINQEITSTADWRINRLYELGASKRQIKKHIKDTLDLSTQEINHLYMDVIRKGYARNEQLYKTKGKPMIKFEDNKPLQQLISAVKKQTEGECKNITQSLGFAVRQPDNTLKFEPIAEYYQRTLDNAAMSISSGAFDYNTVLKRTVKEMTDSGLRTVDYESGWSNRVDVAARRAVMTGFNQVVTHITEENAEKLGTDYFEVTYHMGARPTHQPWQGRVYSKQELEDVCGYGTVSGLKGANCYHDFNPFFKGISKRTYSDEELDRMNKEENTPKQYGDKHYTTYEALQRQRRLETKMRAQRQEIKLLEQGGADEKYIIAAKSRYNGTSAEYSRFSKAMELPQQRERVTVDGLGNIGATRAAKSSKTVTKYAENGIMSSKETETAVSNVHKIGEIDIEKYKCVTNDILTNEVVITDPQIAHIKERHPNDYEKYFKYAAEILKSPDYILEANKPNTAFILKHITDNDKRYQLILRLKTSSDPERYKNSVITFLKVEEKRYNRYLRTKKILYKSE